MKTALQIALILLVVCTLPSAAWPQQIGNSQGGRISTVTAEGSRPWLMDLDARIQRRSDRSLRSSRLKVAGTSVTSSVSDIIQGSKNPELLLPWELHRFLISTAFYEDPAVTTQWRSRLLKAVPDLGVHDTFWATLQKVSADYLKDQREITALSVEMKSADVGRKESLRRRILAKESGQCQQRLIALERAYETFGREWFGEFLYRAVAPSLTISSTAPTSAEKLRFVSRGCR